MVEEPMLTRDDVLAAVQRDWPLTEPDLEPLAGGMYSRTWSLTATTTQRRSRGRWVAKLVPGRQHGPFTGGLRAAATVAASGIPAGAPLETVDGGDHLDLPDGVLALLHWVDGVPLQGHEIADHEDMGRTLAAAHAALRAPGPASPHAFPDWLDPDAEHLDVEDWIRPAVRGALRDYRDLDHTAVGLLHGDPAPEAFLRPATPGSRCSLIDWSSAEHGPLLYDVASALMYIGGPARGRAMLEAYARASPLLKPASDREIAVLLALRQAVQADYFARRPAGNDLTGITDAAANREGLHHAKDNSTSDSAVDDPVTLARHGAPSGGGSPDVDRDTAHLLDEEAVGACPAQ